MTTHKVIWDMVQLVINNNLHKGAHVYKVMDWCTWAVNSGHVEYVYEGDVMIGFLDWIRSDIIPGHNDYQAIIDLGTATGRVGIALNCCVLRGKDTLRKLIKMARAKNESCELMCWHDRKADRMRYFRWHPHQLKGRKLCNETVVC